MRSLQDVSQEMPIPFAFIIDEWDCIFRERKEDSEAQKRYLDFLRNLLKGNEFVGLAKEYKADFTEMKRWYDGYHFPDTYEALRAYIELNFNGLRDTIVELLAGGTCPVNTGTFSNDMTSFQSKDDILTLLIHLGYLGYDEKKQRIYSQL